MERDHRLANISSAIAKLANECVGGGCSVVAVGNEIALGFAAFMQGHGPAAQAAAVLRDHAFRLAATDHRKHMPESEQEMLDLADRGLQFIRTLELAGISTNAAVTALQNACTVRVAQERGAAGAAAWLKGLAALTEKNAEAFELIANRS